MIGKMTGKQAVVVILGITALISGPIAFSYWLEQQKNIKVEEIRSRDHIAALQAIHFASSEQTKTVQKIIDVLDKQGDAGKRALEVVSATNEALLKAASQTIPTGFQR